MGFSVTLPTGTSQCLYSLQTLASQITETNNRLATGKKINTALDDPINYFASQSHLYRASDLQMRKEEMGEAIQLVTAADSGIEAILDLVDAAKALAQSALTAEDQSEVNDLETQFNDLLSQIDDLGADSGYKGVNLLAGTSEQLVVYFDETGDSSITLTGEDASYTGLGITLLSTDDWWNTTDGVPDTTTINATIAELDAAKVSLRSMAKTLSTQLTTIEVRQDFTSNMINTLNDGAAQLTNADLNEESANLLTLQTQQQLAINSLSISAQSNQLVLNLFA